MISCRAELVVSSSPSRFQLRGGRPPKISCPSAASIGLQHTMAELVRCSLINCWSHVQNVTRGPWPSMQASGDGRRKRPWSGLPAPNVVIRKKGVLAALTPKEKAHSNTKLQVVISSAIVCACARRRGARTFLDNNLDCTIAQVSAATGLSSSLPANGSRECAADDNLREAIQRGWQNGFASSLRSSR